MSNKELMVGVMEKISNNPEARKQLAQAIGTGNPAEVQRTVRWALKDLARRLRVLQFDMGETFELTDGWAGDIGLPVRPKEAQDQIP